MERPLDLRREDTLEKALFHKHPGMVNYSVDIVEWVQSSEFASDGDCGSVYYYKFEECWAPLAVHIASGKMDTGERVSIGVPLRYCQFIGHELFFDTLPKRMFSPRAKNEEPQAFPPLVGDDEGSNTDDGASFV